MRSWKFVVPVLVIVLFASSALAAGSSMSSSSSSSGNWTFGINGGGSFPTGDYGDKDVLGAGTGWNIGGQGDYWMSSMWGFGVDASYHANNAQDDFNTALVPIFGTGSEAKYSTIQYGAHAIFMIPTQGTQVFPYLQGGVGGYNVKQKIEGGTTTSDESVNKFGVNIGAGVDFRATPVLNLGVGGTYHYVTKDEKIGDKALNWFGVQARVNFKIPTSGK